MGGSWVSGQPMGERCLLDGGVLEACWELLGARAYARYALAFNFYSRYSKVHFYLNSGNDPYISLNFLKKYAISRIGYRLQPWPTHPNSRLRIFRPEIVDLQRGVLASKRHSSGHRELTKYQTMCSCTRSSGPLYSGIRPAL